MDEDLAVSNAKLNILFGVKDLVARSILSENNTIHFYLANDVDGYPKCSLYQCIRNQIQCHMEELLETEINSIETVSENFVNLAITASVSKFITTPKMAFIKNDVREGIDQVLTCVSHYRGCAESEKNCDNPENIVRIIDHEVQINQLHSGNVRELAFEYNCLESIGQDEVMLSKLRKASLAEVFETSCWSSVRIALKKCLLSENESIFFNALKLHAKYLLSSSNIAMYESFINLKSSLMDHFIHSQHNEDYFNCCSAIDLSKLVYVRPLKIMSLISEFFKDGSKKFTRLPVKLIEEVVENIIDMMSFFPDDPLPTLGAIYPLHLLSLVDPKANWIQKSFYHASVRIVMFKRLARKPKLLKYTLKCITLWLDDLNCRNEINSGVKSSKYIYACQVRFAAFSHCLSLYNYCMKYRDGRSLYLESCSEINAPEVPNAILLYVYNASAFCKTALLLHETFLKHLSIPFIRSMSNSLLKASILDPLYQIHQEMKQSHNSQNFPVIKQFLVDHIKALLQQKLGLDYFITTQKYDLGTEIIELCPARILLMYVCKFLRKIPNESFQLVETLLECCVLLGRSPRGLVEIEESNLIPILAALFCKIKANGTDNALCKVSHCGLRPQDSDLLDVVTYCIMRLTLNLGRVWLIERERILLPLMFDCYNKPLVPWDHVWFQKLVTISSLMPGGSDALLQAKVQHIPLLILWKSWTVDITEPIGDRRAEENLQIALNVFFPLCSNFRGVKSLLAEQEGSEGTLTEGVHPPANLQELFEITLGIAEDSAKQIKQDLCSGFTSTHETYISLRLLRFMLSSLDTTLLLQQKFLIQEHVMKIWNENLSDENGESIVDEISIICDQILKTSFMVEIYAEKNFCIARTPRSSVSSRLDCLPDQWVYCGSANHRSQSRRAPCRIKNDIVKFLGNTRHGLRDVNWLIQLRKVFHSAFSTNISSEIKCNILVEILEEVQKVNCSIPNSARQAKVDWSGRNSPVSLFPEDFVGIMLTVRYGVKLNMLLSTPAVHSNFAQLIRSTHGRLKVARDEFSGFDWFLASVFLLCCGNIDRCQLFVNNILRLQVVPFLWTVHGESLSRCDSTDKNYKNDFIFLLIEQVEMILSLELPKVFAAFQLSSGSLAVLVHQWISQCFWNVLEWSEIKNFLCMMIIHEADYIVYFCVAIFYHLEPQILQIMSTSTERFWELMKINPVGHFHLGKYMSFIEKLCKTHHSSVLRCLIKCFNDYSKS